VGNGWNFGARWRSCVLSDAIRHHGQWSGGAEGEINRLRLLPLDAGGTGLRGDRSCSCKPSPARMHCKRQTPRVQRQGVCANAPRPTRQRVPALWWLWTSCGLSCNEGIF